MKRWKLSLAMVGLATSLVLARVHADNHHERACSDKILNGSYGFYRTGTTSTGPLAGGRHFFRSMETELFLGVRALAGTESSPLTVPILGPYEVSADCTAKFLTDTGVEVARVFIVDGGNEIYLFSETAGNAVYGVAKKIHTGDD